MERLLEALEQLETAKALNDPFANVIDLEFRVEQFAGLVAGRAMRVALTELGKERNPERGQSLLEFALVLPLMILLLLGGVDLITLYTSQQNVEYIAEESARCSAVNGEGCQQGIEQYAQMLASDVKLMNSNELTAIENECRGCSSITVTYRWAPVFPGVPHITLKSTAQFTAQP